MITKSEITRGTKVTYTKEIMFKGNQEVTATVVAVTTKKILLDNGDELWIVNA